MVIFFSQTTILGLNNVVTACRQRHLSASLFTFGKSEDLERLPIPNDGLFTSQWFAMCILSFCIKALIKVGN